MTCDGGFPPDMELDFGDPELPENELDYEEMTEGIEPCGCVRNRAESPAFPPGTGSLNATSVTGQDSCGRKDETDISSSDTPGGYDTEARLTARVNGEVP